MRREGVERATAVFAATVGALGLLGAPLSAAVTGGPLGSPAQHAGTLFVPFTANGGEPPVAQPRPTVTPESDSTPLPTSTATLTLTPVPAPIPTSTPFDVDRPTDPEEVVFSYGVSGRWCTTVPQADEWVFRQIEKAPAISLYGDNRFLSRDTRPGLSVLLGRKLTNDAGRQFLSNLVAAVRFHALPDTLTVTQCADYGTADFFLNAGGEASDVQIHEFLCSGRVYPPEYNDEVQLLQHILATAHHLASDDAPRPLPVEQVTLYARRFPVGGEVPEWEVEGIDLSMVAAGGGERLEGAVARAVVTALETEGAIYRYCGGDIQLKAFSSGGSTYVVGALQELVGE